ncbi:MAG: hypothetical protein AAB323_01735 [Pseudomonadota bacterium]
MPTAANASNPRAAASIPVNNDRFGPNPVTTQLNINDPHSTITRPPETSAQLFFSEEPAARVFANCTHQSEGRIGVLTWAGTDEHEKLMNAFPNAKKSADAFLMKNPFAKEVAVRKDANSPYTIVIKQLHYPVTDLQNPEHGHHSTNEAIAACISAGVNVLIIDTSLHAAGLKVSMLEYIMSSLFIPGGRFGSLGKLEHYFYKIIFASPSAQETREVVKRIQK